MSERHFPFFRAFFRHPPCRALHRFSGREASAVFLSGPQKPDGLPRARTRPDGSACARTRLHGSACARAGPPDFLCAQRKRGGFPFPPLPDAVSPPYDGCFPRGPFLPEKKRERRELLERYAASRETLLFHCAPQDADEYIALLFEAFGERRACAVREITKLHEESVPFLLSQGLPGEKRGEYVLVVEGAGERENPLNALPVREHVLHYMRAGLEKKEALKRAAKDRGVSKSELYKETLDL